MEFLFCERLISELSSSFRFISHWEEFHRTNLVWNFLINHLFKHSIEDHCVTYQVRKLSDLRYLKQYLMFRSMFYYLKFN